jgi:HAD superfamily hydrolase (TIGR01509 family)
MAVLPVLKTVFWDVDGTLADTEMDGHRPAFNRAFAEQGLNWSWDRETYKRLLSIPGGSLRMKTFAQQQGDVLSDAQFAQLRVSKHGHYLNAVRAGAVSLRPGVARLLRELQARAIAQWIVTSSGAASVSALLDTLFPAGDHPFAGVISANDVSRHKPNPEPYLRALECSNTKPDEALAFEDSTPGLRSARAAGLRCLLMPSPWDQELYRFQDQAVVVLDHLGSAELPCRISSGPPCVNGLVTLEYLQTLLVFSD